MVAGPDPDAASDTDLAQGTSANLRSKLKKDKRHTPALSIANQVHDMLTREPRARYQRGEQQELDRDDSFDFPRNLWSEEEAAAEEPGVDMEESGPGSEDSSASAARLDHFTRDRGPAVVKFNLDDESAERVVKVKIKPPHDAQGDSALPVGAA